MTAVDRDACGSARRSAMARPAIATLASPSRNRVPIPILGALALASRAISARSNPPTAPPLEPLGRAYVVGLVGDHDHDGREDYAVAGRLHRGKDRRIVVRIRSGASDIVLEEFDTPVVPLCPFVVHDAHVARIGDLNGDGAFELGAWDGRAWLLDGRTGKVLRDFGPSATVLGSPGDLDRDGVPDIAVDEPPTEVESRHRAGPAEHVRYRSGTDLRPIEPRPGPGALERARIEVLLDPSQALIDPSASVSAARVRRKLEERRLEDSVHDFVSIELRELGASEPTWVRALDFELAFDEHGGIGDLRVASPGDLDGDGAVDVALAMPACFVAKSFCGVLSRRTGAVLWRSSEILAEALNPSVDLLGDRDGDRVADLLVSIAGEGSEGEIAVLSGRTGAVLRRFAP
jgi:hypothetical protein